MSIQEKERRKKYNAEWWQRNRERRKEYNRSALVKGKSKFETGEKERAKEKKCSICKNTKPAAEFYLSNTNRDGLHGWCKDCSDKRTTENARKRLGVTPEKFEFMLKEQGGVCAICKKPDFCNKAPCVDHDHKTGEVRGVLCSACNTAIGMMNDDTKILANAIIYLDLSKSP